MIVAIHQPEHLPWIGFFNKISKCDKFVILDNVQFKTNDYQNRNKIIGTNGLQWLSIPVITKDHINKTIKDIKVMDNNWRKKYLQTIYQSYSKYNYFNEVYPLVEEAINLDTEYLIDINIKLIKSFCKKLDINPEFIFSSDLKPIGKKNDLILDICEKTKADKYISGSGGKNYMELDSFKSKNIDVEFNNFRSPTYNQKRTKEFISNLSALDLFMNIGFNNSKNIIIDCYENEQENRHS